MGVVERCFAGRYARREMADEGSSDSVLRQFMRHAWQRKIFWMTPIVIVLGFMALLYFAGHSNAPFRYTLF